MWLRWVVSNFLNQMADQKIRQVVAKAKLAVDGQRDRDTTSEVDGQAESPECEIALVFALNLESGALLDHMERVVTTRCASYVEHLGFLDGRRIVVAEAGVGQQAARQATEDVIQIHHPKWVVSAGFTGSLNEQLRPGHLLMADTIVDCHHEVLSVGFQIDPHIVEQNRSLHVGRLLTIDELVRDTQRKRELAQEFDAVACDMETMSIAQACRDQQVRFLSVRIVSDGLDDQIPAEVECMLDQPSLAGKLGAATLALIQKPRSLKGLWHLRERALRAADRLAKFLAGVIPQLKN